MAVRITKQKQQQLKRAVAAAAPGPTSASAIAATAGVSGPTARRALVDAGFTQESRGHWVVAEPVDSYPEIARAEARAEAAEAEVAEVAEAVAVAVAEGVVDVVEPAERPHEFIDLVDSWTIPVPADLQAMADLMGLRIEVRVWREPEA